MAGGRANIRRTGRSWARSSVQRRAVRRSGQYRGPPHRAPLSRLGPARGDWSRACPYAVTAVGPLLCQERARMEAHAGIRQATVLLRPDCSTSIIWSEKQPGTVPCRRRLDRPPGVGPSSRDPPSTPPTRRPLALAEGMVPDAIGEAISLAANQLVLRDAGRTAREAQSNKPVGSVHGDSIGVHACDSANAWRNMARVSNPRNTVACLILGAYQVAYDRVERGGDFLHWSARPLALDIEPIREQRLESLLDQLDTAIRAKDQIEACAVAYRLGELDQCRAVFDRLLSYAVTEDGYAPCREVLSNRRRGIRHHPQSVSLAAACRTGTGDRERVWPAGALESARRASDSDFGIFLPWFPWVVGLVLAFWLFSDISYTVKPYEQAVVLRFGKYHATTLPGLAPQGAAGRPGDEGQCGGARAPTALRSDLAHRGSDQFFGSLGGRDLDADR